MPDVVLEEDVVLVELVEDAAVAIDLASDTAVAVEVVEESAVVVQVGVPGLTGPSGAPTDIVPRDVIRDDDGFIEAFEYDDGRTKTIARDGGGRIATIVLVEPAVPRTITTTYIRNGDGAITRIVPVVT